jgi:hypothetical protein
MKTRFVNAALLFALVIGTTLTTGCTDSSGPGRGGLQVTADSVRFWVGQTARLSAAVTDSKGVILDDPVTWESLTPAVSVDQNGVVTAIKRGKGEIRLTAGELTRTIAVTSLPIVSGRLVSPVDANFSAFSPTWKSGNVTDVGSTSPTGQFTIRLSQLDDKGELLIDAPPPSGFHPFLYQLNVDSASNLSVVMVPTAWTIQRGIYRGETVPISLDLVMDEPNLNPYYFSYASVDGRSLTVEENSWPLDIFPVKVAIDHRNSSPDVTPEDSAAVWDVWNRMEVIFGINMFEPVQADPSWWPDAGVHPIHGVIRFSKVSGTVDGGQVLSTTPPLEWHQELGSWSVGGRFSSFTVIHRNADSGEYVFGTERTPIGDRIVWAHEMMHILGVGHTSRIPSTQGPAMRTPEPSKYDVAYTELLREIMRLERSRNTFLGLMPATIGQRRVQLGKSTLPTLAP